MSHHTPENVTLTDLTISPDGGLLQLQTRSIPPNSTIVNNLRQDFNNPTAPRRVANIIENQTNLITSSTSSRLPGRLDTINSDQTLYSPLLADSHSQYVHSLRTDDRTNNERSQSNEIIITRGSSSGASVAPVSQSRGTNTNHLATIASRNASPANPNIARRRRSLGTTWNYPQPVASNFETNASTVSQALFNIRSYFSSDIHAQGQRNHSISNSGPNISNISPNNRRRSHQQAHPQSQTLTRVQEVSTTAIRRPFSSTFRAASVEWLQEQNRRFSVLSNDDESTYHDQMDIDNDDMSDSTSHITTPQVPRLSHRNNRPQNVRGISHEIEPTQPVSYSHFRYKIVCKLDCRYCSRSLCVRAMKAILLADTKVELYSTDTPPSGVSLVNDDYTTENCRCRISDVACLGCGNIVGYHVTQPCDSCLDSCNNGHFWMFNIEGVVPLERLDPSETKPMLWAFLPTADKDNEANPLKMELILR